MRPKMSDYTAKITEHVIVTLFDLVSVKMSSTNQVTRTHTLFAEVRRHWYCQPGMCNLTNISSVTEYETIINLPVWVHQTEGYSNDTLQILSSRVLHDFNHSVNICMIIQYIDFLHCCRSNQPVKCIAVQMCCVHVPPNLVLRIVLQLFGF